MRVHRPGSNARICEALIDKLVMLDKSKLAEGEAAIDAAVG